MDPSYLRRLAFIKYLLGVALNQSQLPEPVGAASILAFHDAIELFNYLACEYLDIDVVGKSKRQADFLEYWDLISGKLGIALPQRESMKRLNRARVSLKHHGILPSSLDIESFRASVNSFFLESSSLIFNVDFSDISMLDLIVEEHTREHLHNALNILHSEDLEAALGQVALAFRYLIDNYDKRKKSKYVSSPFSFGEKFGFNNQSLRGLTRTKLEKAIQHDHVAKDLSNYLQDVSKTLEAVQSAMRMLALGIDYPKYSRFKMFMPSVIQLGTGEYQIQGNITQNWVVAPEDVQYCIDFVIETALQMQRFDYARPKQKL